MNFDIYIEDNALGAYAASRARLLNANGECSGRDVLKRLERSRKRISAFRDLLEKRFDGAAVIPAEFEWILDNYYLIDRECAVVEGMMKKVRRLRCGEGLALGSSLCRSLVISGQGAVSEERCALFLRGFQTVTPLRRCELLAFPALLRAAIIECLEEECALLEKSSDTSPLARSVGALFSSLRLVAVMDTEELLSSADCLGDILALDPTGEYSRMDFDTRQRYLAAVEKLAAKAGMSEMKYARRLVEKAKKEGKHVGFYLFPEKGRTAGAIYICVNILLSVFLALLLAFWVESIASALLLILPVSQCVKSLTDYVLSKLVRPQKPLRMDVSGGVPPEGKTVCAVSVLLTDPESAVKQVKKLEMLRWACVREGRNVQFALLADLPAADTEKAENDRAVLSACEAEILALNRRYGGGFYLLTRPRRFDGEKYTGYERKRGALLELAKLLCDEKSELSAVGDTDALFRTRYILALDSDTTVYPGAVGQLIGMALHPLNRPEIDPDTHTVTRGHAIFHPRIDTELSSAGRTDFALLFAGSGGCDPYLQCCGEIYTDAFDCGGFAGKGLIDARALLECTASLPAGRILSHDALEGAYLRGTYAGDTEFSDAFPASPLSYYRRMHRWVRGDWQNAPWIFKKELRDMDCWRLFDSIRRSLVSVASLASLLLAFLLPSPGTALAGYIALLAFLNRLFLSLAERRSVSREKIRLRQRTRVLSGPGGAIVQTFMQLWLLPYEAYVCFTAAVSSLWRMTVSRKNLLKWETSAQSDKKGGSFYREMWFAPAVGLGLLIFSPVIIGKSCALLWLLAPAAAFALSLDARRDSSLSVADREQLRSYAETLWQYFERFCTAEDNFLPPDNFQEQPPLGLAHRTSPTNIGLAMVSAVAACDIGIISPERAVSFLVSVTGTLEKMKKPMGHLCNWYDTVTLAPLLPEYISTVDSGNLFVCLLTVRSFLRERGEGALEQRVSDLLRGMDFAPLFDSRRHLFYICYDPENNRGVGGWYDLLASEAMLTAYAAVASGQVSTRLWRTLSRAQLQKNGYRGLASWTGTMFEYMMSTLFLPIQRGSLLYESLCFCLYAQKSAVSGIPWGISESAFYSLDSKMNYRYKPSGVQALALRRGQDEDTVISPYSSFLALALDAAGAVTNLRLLQRMGAYGPLGFYEAVDFTPGRCRNPYGEKVRCYMAHHTGMSLIACANALCGGSIRRRFISDAAMGGSEILLQEQLPHSGAVIRRQSVSREERRPHREGEKWLLHSAGQETGEHFCLLSNGVYSILSSSSGKMRSKMGEITVYADAPRVYIDAVPIFPGKYSSWVQSEDTVSYACKSGGTACRITVCSGGSECGEVWTVETDGYGGSAVSVAVSLAPILARRRDWESHSAYWRLGIQQEEAEGILLLRRCGRDNLPTLWMAMACSESGGFSYDGDRAVCRALTSAPAVRFSVCTSFTREEAIGGARRLLTDNGACRGNMVSAAASRLGMAGEEIGQAMELLPALLTATVGGAPVKELWKCGISGDEPIIACPDSAKELTSLLRRVCLLRCCGMRCELAVVSGEQGEYIRPLYQRIAAILRGFSLEELLGAGIYVVPASCREAVMSRAALIIGGNARHRFLPEAKTVGAPRQKGSVPCYGFEGGKFTFTVNNSLPARAWQCVLTNGHMGYLAADCGCGNMWLENAREMRIDRPPEKIEAIAGNEALWVEYAGENYSLFAANDGAECSVEYTAVTARWEKKLGGRTVSLTAFIAPECSARVFLLTGAAGMKVHWTLLPVMGGGSGQGIKTEFSDNFFTCRNSDSFLPGAVFRASCSEKLTDGGGIGTMALSFTAAEHSVLVCGGAAEEEIRALCSLSGLRPALEEALSRWRALEEKIQFSGLPPRYDAYINHWCIRQTVLCRLWGRSSLYQSGGAIGFRDQLQDAVNLLLITPSFARERILDGCAHQYEQGDVMHWWHPSPLGDRGLRTRCSDDLLWLVWALCEYGEATGELSLASEKVAFLTSPPLKDEEHDRYETAESGETATVLEHARRSLALCVERGFGPHGLPLFLGGDWNDAMNAVDGESVWLGWFFADCCHRFARLLRRMGQEDWEYYSRLGEEMKQSCEKTFNGRFYPRGFFADGTPVGGDSRIDSVCQSWAVFCGAGHGRSAVESALRALVDRQHRTVKLLTPPYTDSERRVGYISGYGEGVRENGGQYTHAAIWLARACFMLGMESEGMELMDMLLPEGRDMAVYGGEPYVLAADVSDKEGHRGEAGWTWYTGSAGWYYRVFTENVLGLKRIGGKTETVSPPLIPFEIKREK